MKRLITWSFALTVALTAGQANAQAPGAAPGKSGAAADPNAPATIQQIHNINAKMIQIGKLAADRGTTPEVKQYGQKVASEHQRLDSELSQIAQKRGIQLRPAEQITSEQGHVASLQPVMSKSGIEFDRAIIDALVTERENRVPELKRLRDQTPGSDAELKGWVDKMEVSMEKMRNEARDVRQAVRQDQQQQQRQGRKPQ